MVTHQSHLDSIDLLLKKLSSPCIMHHEQGNQWPVGTFAWDPTAHARKLGAGKMMSIVCIPNGREWALVVCLQCSLHFDFCTKYSSIRFHEQSRPPAYLHIGRIVFQHVLTKIPAVFLFETFLSAFFVKNDCEIQFVPSSPLTKITPSIIDQ